MADSKPVAIPRKKHKMMCRATIEQIEKNNPSMKIIDFTGSSLFQMKVKDYMVMLANALTKNTVVEELYLEDLGIGNKQAENVAQIIAQNKSIKKLSLANNKFDGALVEEFARALPFNDTLVEVDFIGAEIQDFALDEFLKAYDSNITLLKVNWRLESRISFRLTKCNTRNITIARLKKAGRDYSHLLPTGYGETPAEDFSRAKTAPVVVKSDAVDTMQEEEVLSSAVSPDAPADPPPKEDEENVEEAKNEEAEEEVQAKEEVKQEEVVSDDAGDDSKADAQKEEEPVAKKEEEEEPAPASSEPKKEEAPVAKEEPELKSKKSPLDQVINRSGRSQSEIIPSSKPDTKSDTRMSISNRKNLWENKRRTSLVGTKKRRKKLLPRALIAKIKENDPEVVDANFDNSSVFSSKKLEFCQLLQEAMKTNTNVKSLSMQLCGLDNECARYIADIIADTGTLEKIDLSNNRIHSQGGEYIAKALEENTSVVEMNLLKIELGNEALTKFLNMFDHNITLLKIIWRLDSRLSFRLNKALTRNKEILRRKNTDKSYFHLLPDKFRELEPEKPDV